MFGNTLKMIMRMMKKNKGYSFINILGLAIGMTCFMMMLLYVRYELSYDRYHKNADRIYRVIQESMYIENNNSAITPNPLGDVISDQFPEVISAVRISAMGSESKVISTGDKSFKEERFFLVDPTVFEIFSFPLIRGNPQTVLRDPWSVALTEDMANKYFGDEDPMGKTLTYEGKFDFHITGILKNIPDNSHFRCDFMASMGCANDLHWKGFLEDWTQSSVRTYLLLEKDCNLTELEEKISKSVESRLAPLFKKYAQISGDMNQRFTVKLFLQPLTRIHLHSKVLHEIEPNGDIRTVYFYSTIAIIILLIACINFMNLVTARSTTRFREVGMRKVLGADRFQLIRQFLSESTLMSSIAFLVALVLMMLFYPSFRNLVGHGGMKILKVDLITFVGLFGTMWVCGLLSGSYPAIYLSAFQPIKVLKGDMIKNAKRSLMRNMLVTVQFIISTSLILCTLIILKQVHYLRNKNLGLNKDHVLAIQLPEDVRRRYASIKNELKKHVHILGVTATSNLPHRNHAAKRLPWGNPEDNIIISINFMRIDDDFIDVMQAELIDGRDFSKDYPTDHMAFIINETAVKVLGIENPVGKQITWQGGIQMNIIGVIKDFHFKSLHHPIEPIVLYLQRGGNIDHILIKLNSDKIPETLDFIKKTMNRFSPDRPLEYFFLDEDIESMYRSESKFMYIFEYFTFLAIFIASLGLFGLAALTIQQRTKEIGIRKVLGASLSKIVLLLIQDFMRLIVIANVIAWPITYYWMRKWLQQFAFRINIDVWIFIITAVFAFTIAIITLCFQTVKAAVANPVHTLRYE